MNDLLTKFAADYDYQLYSVSDTGASETSGGVTAVFLIIYFAVIVFILAAMWRIFTKARQPGWAAIVPIYNTYILLKIVGRPGWWLLLFFIPFVNIVVGLILMYELAKSFGKDIGFTLAMIFLPFIAYPMLAWGQAKYVGPYAAHRV